MMRVLEFIVALIIVIVVAVVVGVVMPGSGHVERSLVVGKDMRQVYDVLNNFRRFPEYSVQREYDRNIKFDFSGKAYGPGAEISWASDDGKVGNGKFTIASADPSFDKVDSTAKKSTIVWNVDNDWRGNDKHFTLDLERNGSRGQLTKVTWSYDVDYGFNLINRYSNLYIHGDPDAFIQFSLNNLQNVLAAVQNVDYTKLIPYIEQTQPTPVLMVSSSIERKGGLEALNDATDKAIGQIQAAAKKLGVTTTGPRIIYTTNYGDQNYSFDVAMPISATSLNVAGQTVELVAAKAPDLNAAVASSSADASSTAGDTAPGGHDRFGRLIVDNDVRAYLAFGGPALKAVWNGTAAGVPQTRDLMKAYAQTHGYKFDEVTNRFYDIEAKPEVKQGDQVTQYAEFDVYLPLSWAPDQTPEQAAGIKPPSLDDTGSDQAPASSSTAAPAAAASAGK
ncbi:polyketide cyclase [Dyella japonica]|uniref:Polyketide cyclase n=1 Tax=Dyella japonica DSM 16301 TaxID=1440762 RepID=A0A0G9H603_9GAMM|nr:polyketide cyclase [Dyella japonica]KLD65250.1 polyketide cyclase [Dyella japonica DSM 16301]